MAHRAAPTDLHGAPAPSPSAESTMSPFPFRQIIDWSTRTFRRERSNTADRDLVAAALEGDSRSLGEIWERHHAMLVQFLDRLGCTESEDLVQELFLKLRSKLPDFGNEGGSLEKWLRRMAYYMYLTHRRGVGRRRIDDVSLGGLAGGVSSVSAKVARADQLDRLLHLLEPEQRELLVLSSEGFSGKELAEMYKTTPANIRVRVHRAREALTKRAGELRG